MGRRAHSVALCATSDTPGTVVRCRALEQRGAAPQMHGSWAGCDAVTDVVVLGQRHQQVARCDMKVSNFEKGVRPTAVLTTSPVPRSRHELGAAAVRTSPVTALTHGYRAHDTVNMARLRPTRRPEFAGVDPDGYRDNVSRRMPHALAPPTNKRCALSSRGPSGLPPCSPRTLTRPANCGAAMSFRSPSVAALHTPSHYTTPAERQHRAPVCLRQRACRRHEAPDRGGC